MASSSRSNSESPTDGETERATAQRRAVHSEDFAVKRAFVGQHHGVDLEMLAGLDGAIETMFPFMMAVGMVPPLVEV